VGTNGILECTFLSENAHRACIKIAFIIKSRMLMGTNIGGKKTCISPCMACVGA
jgi:hypothetical protein